MLVKSFASLLSAAAIAFVLAPPAWAQKVETIGAYTDWTAYKTRMAGKTLCYMASEPRKSEGKYKKRGRVYAMVSHRPSSKATDVVSIHAGYEFREDSKVTVTIGKRKFTLFTHGDTAWADNATDDKALVKALRAGSKMIVRGTSSRGTRTRDVYSLGGSTAAYKAIGKACGIK